ncbi:hypothetical protein H8K20_00600 [Neobittarella massiliensis]|uniref:Uncharacterized protein n=2 Tax=Oscillospiraceae TaxID=216572 RepID=A0A8J6M0R2_9FIRM|nr:hypothetical protein [Neobittarella massiliensis]MBC3514891.1 hypothetical protein [Neobittarella massiliensis]SCJ70037.1 Uncharacterised protein [uncultured Anaerotruncus sp.]
MEFKKMYPQCMALGRIYKIVSLRVHVTGATAAELQFAEQHPYLANTQMLLFARKLGRMTTDIDDIVADLLLVVDPGDWRELQGQPLPLPLQQAWYQGYVAA